MYRRILAALVPDQPEPAKKAMAAARTLCAFEGKITALHVVEEISPYLSSYMGEHYLEKASAEAIADLAEVTMGAENVEPVVVIGHAAQTILDFASKNSIDCIVVASHRPEFSDYLIGSTAARVVRHANCSVHVVR